MSKTQTETKKKAIKEAKDYARNVREHRIFLLTGTLITLRRAR